MTNNQNQGATVDRIIGRDTPTDDAQAEVERRYPGNKHLTYVPLYTQMKREAFIEGVEWARAAGGV